jgi:hypothetical protein
MNQPMPPVTIGIEVRRHDGGEADWGPGRAGAPDLARPLNDLVWTAARPASSAARDLGDRRLLVVVPAAADAE